MGAVVAELQQGRRCHGSVVKEGSSCGDHDGCHSTPRSRHVCAKGVHLTDSALFPQSSSDVKLLMSPSPKWSICPTKGGTHRRPQKTYLRTPTSTQALAPSNQPH